jgi:cobalt-zinc-cadmium efflux system outer membrane protein
MAARRLRCVSHVLVTAFVIGRPVAAQERGPITRADAIAAALVRGPRLLVARADTASAFALLRTARMWQNPALAASYTKSTPNYHVTLELPIDLPYQRSPRVGAARAAREASQYRFQFERAAVALDADTTYTLALAAREHAQLSRRTSLAADSLYHIAQVRRDAGDASDLEVELAAVNAGQAANIAATDSLSYVSAALDLQAVIGLTDSVLAITPTDPLLPPCTSARAISDSARAAGPTLLVASAHASLQSAQLGLRLQRRSVFGQPSLLGGFEQGDPSGAEPGVLPTFGFSVPVPLFNLNRGSIAVARADVDRAQAELALAEVQSSIEIARARRELAIATAKLARDTVLVGAADRVGRMSLVAYREGASSLATVLEAQRNAREVLAQYVDDVAAALVAAAELRVLLLVPEPLP